MIVRKEIKCPECGSINVLRRTGKLKPTNKERGAGKTFDIKKFYCRHCKNKF